MKGATGTGSPDAPNVTECQIFNNVDKYTSQSGVDPVTAQGYTLTVYVRFQYDAFFTHGLCWTESKAVLVENGNLFGGTLYMTLNNCSSDVDTVSPGVQGGGGTSTFYGNQVYAGCADARANFQASNGYWLPGQYSYVDSGRQLS